VGAHSPTGQQCLYPCEGLQRGRTSEDQAWLAPVPFEAGLTLPVRA
jgi:hypothetical protein